jgi:creatinine amidohydrolase
MTLIDVKRIVGSSVEKTIALADFAVLSTGSVEWHGPHLPLGTDTLLADGFTSALAEGNWQAVLYPTVSFTASPGQTRSYPGTIGIRPETMVEYYTQILEGILASGFRRVLIVNAHDSNMSTMRTAMEWVSGRTTASLLLVNWFELVSSAETAELFGPGEPHGHGGSFETSGLMAFAPDTVDLTAVDDIPPRPRLAAEAEHVLIESHPSPWFGWSGNISQVTPHTANELRRHATRRLIALVDAWLLSPLPEPPGFTR